MNEVKELVIADMTISTISDSELENAFITVVNEHKEVIESIHKSMVDADEAYRKYLNPDFEPDEQEAKIDRATLNKAEKNIQEKFSALKTAYEKPLLGIETNIKSIRNAIKEASGIVDSAVKVYETKQQEQKKKLIEEYFNTKDFFLVPLDKIFNDRWLNKTYKMTEIRKEIDGLISKIYTNIKILEQIPNYGATAKTLYLDTLDMEGAMGQINTMKANAERLAKEQAEREERERREQIARNSEALEQEKQESTPPSERMNDLVSQALDIPLPEVEVPEKPEIMEFTLRFRGTKKKLFELRAWMAANDIAYEKIG
jgi:F0F1-type ATP synthase membrane subunit b/b'